MSGDDIGATVTFGRVLRTFGTQDEEQGLPEGSCNRSHPYIPYKASQFLMPRNGSVERVGAYYCLAAKGQETERITTTVMSNNSKIFQMILHFV